MFSVCAHSVNTSGDCGNVTPAIWMRAKMPISDLRSGLRAALGSCAVLWYSEHMAELAPQFHSVIYAAQAPGYGRSPRLECRARPAHPDHTHAHLTAVDRQ